MTLKVNLGRGQTNGASVTTAAPPNSGDTAFTAVSKGVAPSVVIWDSSFAWPDSASAANHGSTVGIHATPASGSAAATIFRGMNTASGAASYYLYMPALPTVTETYLVLENTNTTSMCKLNVTGAGKMTVTDQSGSTPIYTGTATLAINTLYRLEMYAVPNAAAASGTVKASIYLADSATAIAGASFTSSTASLGSSFFGGVQWGKYDSGTSASDLRIFEPRVNDGASDLIGVPAPQTGGGTAPTAAFTPKINGLAVAVDGTASAVTAQGAAISGYSWNWGDGTANGTGATASHTYTTAGKYTQTLTVTDSNGSTGIATTRVVVAAASGTVLPGYTQPGTGNIIVPGAAGGTPTAQEVLTDASTDSWLEGPTGSFTQDIPIGASLVLNAGQSEVWDCTFGVYDKSGQGIAPASPSVVTAELREGTPGLSGGSDTSQLRSSLSGLTAPFETSTTVGAHVAVEFPSADLATITDPTKVFLRLKGTVS